MPYLGVKPADITSATEAEISGDLTVDTNTLHVDAANNRLGVNTTSMDAALQVQNGDITVGWADNFIGAQFQDGSAFRLGMKFGTVNRTTKIVAETSDNNGEITFETNGSERARITDNGLTFNGDTAAVNALDDYEEGTFTPTIATGVSVSSYDIQRGSYTKIGNTVILAAQVEVNGSSRTGSQVNIGGLPFAAVNDGNKPTHGGYITYQSGFSNNVNQIFIGSGGNDLLSFHEVGGTSLIGSELSGASFEVRVIAIYKTS